ncbi:hypothetical protein GCM10020001_071150 [Nonomuraea salmonea]
MKEPGWSGRLGAGTGVAAKFLESAVGGGVNDGRSMASEAHAREKVRKGLCVRVEVVAMRGHCPARGRCGGVFGPTGDEASLGVA